MQSVAGASKEFQKEITEETNVDELLDADRQKVIYLTDEQLEDDPNNEDIYGESEVEELAEAMKKYGFQGVILAYPIGNDKYRIESGHRRRLSARKAGIRTYTVFKTEPPKTEWERIIRLNMGNLHGRKDKPMTNARIAQSLYEAHGMEVKYKKENGLLVEGEETALNVLTAKSMELKPASVEKYRALLKLNMNLQAKADNGYSWSALSAASPLDEEKQSELNRLIDEKTDKSGIESVTRAWISAVIDKLKADAKNDITKQENSIITESPKGRIRRKNGTKIILKSARELHEVLDADNNAIIREEEIPDVLSTLEELKNSINKKIEELDNKSRT